MKIKQIEKKWILNFQQSELVHEGIFNDTLAKQLFNGSDLDNDVFYKEGFFRFYKRYNENQKEEHHANLLKYLHFIGITIASSSISNSIEAGRYVYPQILIKAFYIFKHLAKCSSSLNLNDPFYDNMGDLLFFLRIEEGLTGQDRQLALFDEVELPDLYNRYIELPETYEEDSFAMDLFNAIESSEKSYFITGKAGTGKSTFIQYFTRNTKKNVLLVAFTGIAAINIGGQTIHSLFKFPIKPLLPEDDDIPIFEKYAQKRKLLESAQVIIIDEVSMLRSDLLEAIDFSLRKNGGNPDKLFGGKQMIFVGDVFQLPPVVDINESWQDELFSKVYKSCYFFDSPSFQKLEPTFIELYKIYRQQDEQFIQLLNAVRDYSIEDDGIGMLNQRYDPNYKPHMDEFVIMLTANRKIAANENRKRLLELPYRGYIFKAKIEGDFAEDRYPTDVMLELKRNMQVMFVKNDSIERGKRWVNGTIAKIEYVDEEKVEVKLIDGTLYSLERDTWENRKYEWDRTKNKIISKVTGTFSQYPVKAAWAITIHKSQGLTFDKVCVDLGGGAFASGQLYTALSRCKTFEGLVLKQRISQKDIIRDDRILNFYDNNFLAKSKSLSHDELFNMFQLKDQFLYKLMCIHYPFTTDQLLMFKDLIYMGDGWQGWQSFDGQDLSSLTLTKEYPFERYFSPNNDDYYYLGIFYNDRINWQEQENTFNEHDKYGNLIAKLDVSVFPLNKFSAVFPYMDAHASRTDIENVDEILDYYGSILDANFEFKTVGELTLFLATAPNYQVLNRNLYVSVCKLLQLDFVMQFLKPLKLKEGYRESKGFRNI